MKEQFKNARLHGTINIKMDDKEAFAPALKFSETFLDSLFDKEDVKATMYIDGMTEKIDTVIRKNYKPH